MSSILAPNKFPVERDGRFLIMEFIVVKAFGRDIPRAMITTSTMI